MTPDQESRDERERRAFELAEQLAERRVAVDMRLKDHDKQLDAIHGTIQSINGSIRRNSGEMRNLSSSLDKLSAVVERRDEVSSALTKYAKEMTEKQITAKQFYIGLATVVLMILGLLMGTGHL